MTNDEIALLREIARWRRNHKVDFFQWRPGRGFGVMTEWKLWVDDNEASWSGRGIRGQRQINVTYEPDRSGADEPRPRVLVTKNYYDGEELRALLTTTIAETVDVLAALGFLPPRFSSAYRAGWYASAVWHTMEYPGSETQRLFGDPDNISFPALDPA
jgi:hypothetical protein